MGVPIHRAASEPDIEVLWIAARPASNAATQASRVSRRVPSTSNRTARSRATSGLLLPEPPDLVADVVNRLDRLALLLAGHRRAVHDRAPDRERTANRGDDVSVQKQPNRLVPPQKERVRPGLRFVKHPLVGRNRHAEFVGETPEKLGCLFPSEARPPADLQGHFDSRKRAGEDNPSLRAPIFIYRTIWKSARRRAFGAQVERPREARIEAERLIEHLPRAALLAEGPPGARRVAPRPRVRRIQPEGRVKRRERLLRAVEAQEEPPFASIDDIPTVGRDAECRIAGREGVLRPAEVFVQIRAKQAGFGVRRVHAVKDRQSIGSPAEVPQRPREFEAALRGAEFDGLPERGLRVSVATEGRRPATRREPTARIGWIAGTGVFRRRESVRGPADPEQEGREADEGVGSMGSRRRAGVRVDRLLDALEILEEDPLVVAKLRVLRLEFQGGAEALERLLVAPFGLEGVPHFFEDLTTKHPRLVERPVQDQGVVQ